MFKILKLSAKLLLAFLAVGIVPFSVMGILALRKGSEALSTQAYTQLEGVRGIKKGQMERSARSRSMGREWKKETQPTTP